LFKLSLTALSFLLICASSTAALAGAGHDCDTLSGDAAIAACDQAIAQNPREAISYHNRGVAYFHKGDFDRAIADFSKAIELDPKAYPAYNARGVIYEEKGDVERAIADATKAIELNPN
jgi:tetratricopeptide (TPR) repeat protein